MCSLSPFFSSRIPVAPRFFFFATLCFCAMLSVARSAPATGNGWEVVAKAVLPENTEIGGCEIGGLSGLARDEKTGLWWVVSDGRKWRESKIFLFRIGVQSDKLDIRPERVVSLRGVKSSADPLDAEGIALWTKDRVFISHEGSKSGEVPPGITCFNTKSGKPLFSLPAPLFFRRSPDNAASGLQENRGFESLALSRPKGAWLYSCIESPLLQDLTNPNAPSEGPVRLLRHPLNAPDSLPQQRIYQPDRDALFGSVSDILCLSETRLLVLERQIVWPLPRQLRIRIYEVDFEQADATDATSLFSLAGRPFTPLNKKLVFDSSRTKELHEPDNIEGMAWGPSWDGSPTILLVSDNNFSKNQKTEFALLKKIPSAK